MSSRAGVRLVAAAACTLLLTECVPRVTFVLAAASSAYVHATTLTVDGGWLSR